jgi:ectoine hydroxylase-related dioxygenase (phytanoyl-CoA dioxygenase family)
MIQNTHNAQAPTLTLHEKFLKEGYISSLDVLNQEELLELIQTYNHLESKFSGKIPSFYNSKIHLLVPVLWELLKNKSILDPITEILGVNVLCLGTSFISKSGLDSKKYVAWHQDTTYWQLSEPQAVTAWLALTPSTKENGCVVVVPKTHKKAIPHIIDSQDENNMLGRQEKLASQIDKKNIFHLELNPGQMSLHDGQIIHGSLPNHSRNPRIGFAMRFIPSKTSPLKGTINSATLVSGKNIGGFKLEPMPESFFHLNAQKSHKDAFRNGMRAIFSNDKN